MRVIASQSAVNVTRVTSSYSADVLAAFRRAYPQAKMEVMIETHASAATAIIRGMSHWLCSCGPVVVVGVGLADGAAVSIGPVVD